MAIITKTTTFNTGDTVLAAEHNANFDTLYTEYNGSISNANIKAGAGIVYSKLDLGLGILNADISASAGIPDTKLATISTASKVNLSSLVIPGQSLGDILYTFDGTTYTKLPIGTHGQKLSVGWDSYTKITSHFDGADTATSYTDPIAGAYTFEGTAQLSTAQKKFGTASLLLDGDSDYITLPDSDDWNFGSGNLTIDFWVRLATFGTLQQIVGQWDSDSEKWYAAINPDGSIIFASTGKNFYTNPISLSTNTWYHIAIVKALSGNKIFLNGVSQTIAVDDMGTTTLQDYTGVLNIGSENGTTRFLNGWLDELRISKGIARWTSDFTPPTVAYYEALAWKT